MHKSNDCPEVCIIYKSYILSQNVKTIIKQFLQYKMVTNMKPIFRHIDISSLNLWISTEKKYTKFQIVSKSVVLVKSSSYWQTKIQSIIRHFKTKIYVRKMVNIFLPIIFSFFMLLQKLNFSKRFLQMSSRDKLA